MPSYAPILILGAAAFGFGVFTIVASYLLGRPRPTEAKSSTYECGVPAIGTARERFPIKFYLVAVLFILFDVEIVFLLPYAVLVKPLGVYGLIVVGVFLVVLTIGLVYEWKKGGLEWE